LTCYFAALKIRPCRYSGFSLPPFSRRTLGPPLRPAILPGLVERYALFHGLLAAVAIVWSVRRLRVVGLVALDLPVGAALLAAALLPMALTVELIILGVSGLFGLGDYDYVGPLTLTPAAGVLLLVLALAAAVVTIAILGGLRLAVRAYTRAVLGRRGGQEGPIRELLAERVGDRTLSIAYWLSDREEFVDEMGREVQLPDPGSGRAWTAVEHDGTRVAAIIHDAELDTTPELVNAAAAAAALALDNERLKADLRARVEDLRISRARIVEAADAARRRLERDLHDGAQQQLVSLALDLRLLRARLKGTDAPKMTVGQKVDFVGLLTSAAVGAGALGVRNTADTTLLESQGAYVDASAADVKLY